MGEIGFVFIKFQYLFLGKHCGLYLSLSLKKHIFALIISIKVFKQYNRKIAFQISPVLIFPVLVKRIKRKTSCLVVNILNGPEMWLGIKLLDGLLLQEPQG